MTLVCAVQVVMGIGNTGMISLLPSIGRALGIADHRIAAVFSLSAVLWFLSSPAWGRVSDRYGRKPLILLGLAGFIVSSAAFAGAITLGLNDGAPPDLLFALFLLARGLFGLFGSATNPASFAYIADRTAPEARTAAMARLAGAFGLGTVIGPVLAPLMVVPIAGLAGPMYGFGLLGAAMALAVAWGLTDERRNRAPAPPPASGQKGEPSIWRDGGVRPFLIYAFFVSACQTGQIQTIGFLVIDLLSLPPERAQPYIAAAIMGGAAAALFAQWGLLGVVRMTAQRMMCWGAGLGALGSLVVIAPGGYAVAAIGFCIGSIGLGLARPGYTAAASLVSDEKRQARVAGAIAAVNGVNALLAPVFVWLYGVWRAAPFALIAAVMFAMLAYGLLEPAMRRRPVGGT